MSLALCSSCQRFARPFARCPFCNAPTAAPLPRPKKRGSRDTLLAATAILIACGGTSSPDDGGSTGGDAALDAKADVMQMGDSGGNMDAGKDAPQDAVQDTAEEDNWVPPPPYGSPPIPRRRVV